MEIAKNVQSALSTISGTLAQLKEELISTGCQINSVNAQIAELESMPISLDDWGKYFRSAIEKKAGEHLPFVHDELIASSPHRGHTARNQQPWSWYESDSYDQVFNLALFPSDGGSLRAMCFFFPEVIYERVMERLRERIGAQWGNEDLPSVDARSKSVAELVQQRQTLEERRAELELQINKISGVLSN
ncbi:hypothetical protein [Comamonas testosteroni]|uniref:hypothetical protein n=1 Tax=Comamonas testosteroni TaxID=285 RepID=UPI0006B8F9A1|nr:hypothetical protein [Comamonas testosteroni]